MILGIDGTNWIHALWHTVGPRAPQLASERLAAVCDYFVDKLAVNFVTGNTFHVVVCWDRRSFRHDLHPKYKAGRAEKDSTLVKALEEGPDALSRDALQLAVDGFEADDLLASLAAAAIASQQRAVLCSGDKDLWQCLRAYSVSILRNFKTHDNGNGLRSMYQANWVTEATFRMEMGLAPEQWIDYQCLVGESGDNVPGCPGWGPVAAKRALQKCGSVASMLDLLDASHPDYNPWKLPGGKGKRLTAKHRALIEWRKHYPTTRQLIELRTDVGAVWDCLR